MCLRALLLPGGAHDFKFKSILICWMNKYQPTMSGKKIKTESEIHHLYPSSWLSIISC